MNIAVFPDFSSEAFFADRHSTYRVLREKFPFFRTKIDGEPCIVLTRYADVDDVLRHPLATIQPSQRQPNFLESASTEDLHSASVAKSSIPCMHSIAPRFYQIVAQAFAPQAFAEMRGWMEEIIERHLAELDDEMETDFISTFVSPMIAELVGRLLHVPAAEAGKLLRRSHALIAMICMSSPTNRAFEAPNEVMRLYLATEEGKASRERFDRPSACSGGQG